MSKKKKKFKNLLERSHDDLTLNSDIKECTKEFERIVLCDICPECDTQLLSVKGYFHCHNCQVNITKNALITTALKKCFGKWN